jgi:hypothetical protein
MVTFYYPTIDQSGKKLSELFRTEFEGLIFDIAGGFTRDEAEGAWKDAQGRVHREKVFRYHVHGMEPSQAQEIALAYRFQLNQDTFLIEVDGKPLFIDSDTVIDVI